MNSSNKVLEKFEKGAPHQDWWSDQVSNGLASIGINKDVRDSLQPLINQGKSLLPSGGQVPVPDSGISSYPQATGWAFKSTINPLYIVGGVIAIYAIIKLSK